MFHLTMSQKGSISPGQFGKPNTPWCCAPKVMRFLMAGSGHLWATARRNWPPWENPMALYPPWSSGSSASIWQTSLTWR